MKRLLAAALVLVAAVGAAGCGSSGSGRASSAPAVGMQIKGYQVIWTRGAKLGYLKTYDVAAKGETPVEIHYVEDLDFREVGWVSNNGHAERFDYPPARIGEAKRAAFERAPLPVDTLENSVRRILHLDPTAAIAFRPADEADLKK